MNESHVPAGIMETLRDRSFELMAGDVVGAGKCGENAVFLKVVLPPVHEGLCSPEVLRRRVRELS